MGLAIQRQRALRPERSIHDATPSSAVTATQPLMPGSWSGLAAGNMSAATASPSLAQTHCFQERRRSATANVSEALWALSAETRQRLQPTESRIQTVPLCAAGTLAKEKRLPAT